MPILNIGHFNFAGLGAQPVEQRDVRAESHVGDDVALAEVFHGVVGDEADGFGVHAAQGLRGHGFAGDFGLEDLPQPHVDVRKAVSEDGGELVVAVKPGLHQHRAGNEGIQLAAQEYARVGLGDDRIGVKVGSIGERCLFGGRSRFRGRAAGLASSTGAASTVH